MHRRRRTVQGCTYHMVSVTGNGKPLYASTYLHNKQASVLDGWPILGRFHTQMLGTPCGMHKRCCWHNRNMQTT
jgi:hypothetical protein